MHKLTNLSSTLNQFFNETANNLAITTGFIKRKRKLTGSSFIKAMILGNLGNTNCSIDGFRQFLYETSVEITKQGLNFRFTSSAVEFMEKMFYEALRRPFKSEGKIVFVGLCCCKIHLPIIQCLSGSFDLFV